MVIYNINTWSKITAKNHPYLNVQRIGEGGNCVTYQVMRADRRSGGYFHGHDIPAAGNFFALKFFKRPENIERKDRFLEERDFLEDIDHPSIIRYYDSGTWFGDEDEFPFFVMEYLPNTLKDVIQADQVSLAEKLGYATQMISGLVFLENNGIIHRDIKPSNIFIKEGSCVIGDFGLMKRQDTDPEDDEAKALKESSEEGIPNLHPSPDLIKYETENAELTPKSDVFQMGLVLTQLFTSHNQIPIRNVSERNDHDELEIEEIGHIPGEEISREVGEILEEMIEEDSDDRISPEDALGKFIHKYKIAAEKSRSLNGRVV